MRKITTAAIAGAFVVPAAGHAAAAAPADSVTATYHGEKIDLAHGWHGAHACVDLSDGDVRCYDSRADLQDALAAAARPVPAAGAASPLSCSGGGLVTLYAGIGMGGDSLAFTSTSGAWTNLAPYGFDNNMESWSNSTGCTSFVADGTGGGGDRLTLGAHSSSSNVGTTWKNRASSIIAQ